jgi:hypothetical protein
VYLNKILIPTGIFAKLFLSPFKMLWMYVLIACMLAILILLISIIPSPFKMSFPLFVSLLLISSSTTLNPKSQILHDMLISFIVVLVFVTVGVLVFLRKWKGSGLSFFNITDLFFSMNSIILEIRPHPTSYVDSLTLSTIASLVNGCNVSLKATFKNPL